MIYSLDDEPAWRFKKPLIIAGVLFALGLILLAVWFVYTELFRANDPPSSKKVVTHVEELPFSTVQGRYLFNGTTVWARAVEKYAGSNYAQPFSQLDSLNRTAYDAWSTDLECPITDTVVPYQTQVNNLVFNCRPEFLPEASKYFNLYDLANNHTDNQNGQEGIVSTRAYLDKTDAQYFGNFDPTLTQDICEVIALPVKLLKSNKSVEKGSLPVAFCAWHYFNYFRGPLPEELAVVKQFADIMPVFGFAEMGTEYKAAASQEQVDIAHQLVDSGLEFLLANNPHWVQNTEVYKGKLIVYSLGNFIFDQLDAETQRGASIDTTITVPYNENVAEWVALGLHCSTYHDDCLQQAQTKRLKKVQLTLNYEVVASQGGARQVTRKADANVQASVESRMNWLQTKKELKNE